MVSGISFGQVTNVAQQGQSAPQAVYYATPQMQADTYVSGTKKKKSHPIAKLLVTAAAVLGGSALATKIPAVKKAVEKIAKNPESANMFDKILNGVNKFGENVISVTSKGFNKVKGIFKKGPEITEIKTAEDFAACVNNSNKVSQQTYKNFMKDFNANVGSKTAKETIKKASEKGTIKCALPDEMLSKIAEGRSTFVDNSAISEISRDTIKKASQVNTKFHVELPRK